MLNRGASQNSYNSNVKLGNWNEDKHLQQLQMKEYLHKRKSGTLLVQTVQKLLNQSLEEVGLTYSDDGFVHIGDQLMLYSVRTEGVLSVDAETKIATYDLAYAVTSSDLTQAPVARNVFTIEAVDRKAKEGDVLTLGQPFRLRTHDKVLGRHAWLSSQPTSSTCSAKIAKHDQEVSVSVANTTYATVWQCQFKDINKRFEMEGQHVPANSEIVIQHVSTKTALRSDNSGGYVFNDFGKESEVSCQTAMSINKRQGLYQELNGETTPDIPLRAEDNSNHWAFLSASSPSLDPSKTAPAAQ